MTRTTLAVAADYADAMLVARRWKNALFLLLLLLLLAQIGMFLGVRFYSRAGIIEGSALQTRDLAPALIWFVNFTEFVSIICVVLVTVVLLLIVIIMLVGRLVGVSNVTTAFLVSVLLGSVLFPWQSLWNYPVAGTAQITPAPVENDQIGPRFGLPGALYTWPELERRAHFATTPWREAVLGWARFVGWPVFCMILLFFVQARSARGLRMALGESEPSVEAAAPPA